MLHTELMVDAFLVRKWSYQGPTSPYQRLHLFHAGRTAIGGLVFQKSNLDGSDLYTILIPEGYSTRTL